MENYIVTLKADCSETSIDLVLTEIAKTGSKVSSIMRGMGIIVVETENPELIKNIKNVNSVNVDKGVELPDPESEIQ